jgi:hypothetical protein
MVIRPAEMGLAQFSSGRNMAFRFQARAIGIGSNATTEGGTELTALEDGRLVSIASGKLWRARVSGLDESASGEDDLVIVTDPYSIRFTMFPGREYAVNVGIWVYADRTLGAGAGAAQSILEGLVKHLLVSWPVTPIP